MARSVTSIQTLNQNTRRVTFEYTLQSVDINIQTNQVTLSALQLGVVGDVQLHELVKSSESVSETRIFNSLFVCNYMVIKSFESRNRVDHEVTIPWNVANRVGEESDVQDRRHACQTLQVLPLLYVIIVKVQKLEVLKASECRSWRQAGQLVI